MIPSLDARRFLVAHYSHRWEAIDPAEHEYLRQSWSGGYGREYSYDTLRSGIEWRVGDAPKQLVTWGSLTNLWRAAGKPLQDAYRAATAAKTAEARNHWDRWDKIKGRGDRALAAARAETDRYCAADRALLSVVVDLGTRIYQLDDEADLLSYAAALLRDGSGDPS